MITASTRVPQGVPLSLLRECSAFQGLSDEEMAELASVWRRVELPMGENLFIQGDPPGPVYLVESGRARVIRVEESGQRSVLGLRVRGDLVGERALLTNQPRMATIRAAEQLSVWEMLPNDFRRFLERFPQLGRSLTVYFDHTGIRTFLKSIALLTPMKPEKVRSLVERLERIEARAGTDIVVQGGPGDSMFFVSEGTAEVRENGSLVRTIGAGGVFGERALLLHEARSATVTAGTDMLLFRLGTADFSEMIEDAPAIRRKLMEEMEQQLQYLVLQRDFGVVDQSRTTSVRRRPGKVPRARRLPAWLTRFFPVFAYPVVLQRDEMDCGAACLGSVLASYGIKRSLSRLREETQGREGATLEELAVAAERVGFKSTLSSRSLAELGSVTLPAIAYWNGNHYTVLYAVGPETVHLGDPAAGLRTLPREEFLRGWSGILIELEPTPALRRRESLEANWGPLWRWLSGLRATLGVAMTLMAFEVATFVFLLDRVGLLLEARSAGGPASHHVLPLAAGLVAGTTLRVVRALLFERAWGRWAAPGLETYLDRLLTMPGRFFERMTLSDLMLRAAVGARLRDWLDRTVEPLSFMSTLMTALAIHLVISNPTWGGSVTLSVVAAQVVWSLTAFATRPADLLAGMAHAEATSHLADVLLRNRAFSSARLMGWVTRRWLRLAEQAQVDQLRARRHFWFGAILGLVPLAASWITLISFAPVGLGFVLEALVLSGIVWRFSIASTTVWQVRQDLDRIVEVLANPSERTAEDPPPSGDPPRVEFVEVSCPCGDEDGRWLRGLTFTVEPGESVAVVGPPGCGDWEVIRLLERSLRHSQGTLRLGRSGQVVASHTVTEEPLLLPGTLRENLRASVSGAEPTPEAILRALDVVGLKAWLRRLPVGDATRVGPGGYRLSLDESQRLDLARAFVETPDLLLLYRPLSGVESSARREILARTLQELHGRATVVFVPGALEEARLAKRIAVLLDGRLVGFGTHEELVASSAVYRQLLA